MRHYTDKLPPHEELIESGFDRKTKQQIRAEVEDMVIQAGAKIVASKLERGIPVPGLQQQPTGAGLIDTVNDSKPKGV